MFCMFDALKRIVSESSTIRPVRTYCLNLRDLVSGLRAMLPEIEDPSSICLSHKSTDRNYYWIRMPDNNVQNITVPSVRRYFEKLPDTTTVELLDGMRFLETPKSELEIVNDSTYEIMLTLVDAIYMHNVTAAGSLDIMGNIDVPAGYAGPLLPDHLVGPATFTVAMSNVFEANGVKFQNEDDELEAIDWLENSIFELLDGHIAPGELIICNDPTPGSFILNVTSYGDPRITRWELLYSALKFEKNEE